MHMTLNLCINLKRPPAASAQSRGGAVIRASRGPNRDRFPPLATPCHPPTPGARCVAPTPARGRLTPRSAAKPKVAAHARRRDHRRNRHSRGSRGGVAPKFARRVEGTSEGRGKGGRRGGGGREGTCAVAETRGRWRRLFQPERLELALVVLNILQPLQLVLGERRSHAWRAPRASRPAAAPAAPASAPAAGSGAPTCVAAALADVDASGVIVHAELPHAPLATGGRRSAARSVGCRSGT